MQQAASQTGDRDRVSSGLVTVGRSVVYVGDKWVGVSSGLITVDEVWPPGLLAVGGE